MWAWLSTPVPYATTTVIRKCSDQHTTLEAVPTKQWTLYDLVSNPTNQTQTDNKYYYSPGLHPEHKHTNATVASAGQNRLATRNC